MKKSYHSIVVPIVDAMTALRNCLLCSDADNPLCSVVSNVVVLVIVFPSVSSPWSSLRRTLYRRFSCVQAGSQDPCNPRIVGCTTYDNRIVDPIGTVSSGARRLSPDQEQ